MLDRRDLLELVVRPAVAALGLPGRLGRDEKELRRAECQLLMGTAAVESSFSHLRQSGGGPALGLWQMEGRIGAGSPRTHEDIWTNFLAYRPELRRRIGLDSAPGAERLAYDLRYAAMMARLQYFRAPEPMPAADDLAAMDKLYLVRYNAGGASRPGEFAQVFRQLCADLGF